LDLLLKLGIFGDFVLFFLGIGEQKIDKRRGCDSKIQVLSFLALICRDADEVTVIVQDRGTTSAASLSFV
jgi:hypothetical protein